MKTLINFIAIIVLIATAQTNINAQKCSDVAFNHKNPNGLMSVTLYMYKTTKRLVYGNSSPTIPYKGTLDHNLESLQFGGNVMVKLRKAGTKKWTKYYGMDPHIFYPASKFPWKTIDFIPAKPEWAKGDEIEVLIDDREYGFGFTESNWKGDVMLIKLSGGGMSAGNDKFRSLVVESDDKKCKMRPLANIVYRTSSNIEPSPVLTIFHN